MLLECWTPPCLHYSPTYLRWHLRFPASIPPIGIVAFDGEEPAGFIGATPRTVVYESESFDVYLVSFVGVRPAWRNQGIAGSLYRELLSQSELRSNPVVTFADPDSRGEELIRAQYAQAGYELTAMGRFQGYGFVVRAPGRTAVRAVTEDYDLPRF